MLLHFLCVGLKTWKQQLWVFYRIYVMVIRMPICNVPTPMSHVPPYHPHGVDCCTFRPQVFLYNRCHQRILKYIILHQVERLTARIPLVGSRAPLMRSRTPWCCSLHTGTKIVLHSLTVKQVLTRNLLL